MSNIHKLVILLLVICVSQAQWSQCPLADKVMLEQRSLTVSYGGNVPLQTGQDIQCYNYSLTSAFNCTPNIAIAVNELQSQYSPHLFFSIKTAATSSFSNIPFIIRTHWAYTQWSKITFSFIAQASRQIEVGYYQVDTSTLSSCSSGKQIIAYLPLKDPQPSLSAALTFLNGFQISSIAKNSSYLTPFEVQTVVSSVTSQGITVLLQSTSATQVHSLFISYIAYDPSLPNLVAGAYTYNLYSPTTNLQFSPSTSVSNNNLAFHGFSSFIIRNSQATIQLRTSLLNEQLTFVSSSSVYYLTYSYFFLTGGPCGQCQGYPINHQGRCVASCPPNSYFDGSSCITCNPGYTWNGQQCIYRCHPEQIWDSNSNSCTCPSGKYWNNVNCISCHSSQIWNPLQLKCVCPSEANWNGFICITCSSGQIWNLSTLSCICPIGTYWNNFNCISCPQGQIWSSSVNKCTCPSNTNWNGQTCITCYNGLVWNPQINNCGCQPGYHIFQSICALIPTCSIGQTLDVNTNTCVCSPGANWNGFTCITCNNGQIWSGSHCLCPTNTYWNSYSCISCPSGQIWSASQNVCSCPRGLNWDGFNCISCSGGRAWNPSLNACSCPSGQHWNNAVCISCPSGSNWNGFSCINCDPGLVWNPSNAICQCPSGQQWNGSSCITPCPSGMTFTNGLCSCPPNTYSLNGKCVPQPTCPSGQTWDGFKCIPIQCPPGTYWSQSICTSTPTQNCPAGTYFDLTKCVTNTTNCPYGTAWSGFSCQSSGNCPNGTYNSGSQCIPISQLCPPGLEWKNNQCVTKGNFCPTGTYLNGGICTPIQPCSSGRVWNSTVTQCVCPSGNFWNGQVCLQCSSGQSYQINSGCFCPQGTFLQHGTCTAIPISQCASIANAIWNGKACVCNNGFSPIGIECVCQGLAFSSTFCDRCYTKPNSLWNNGLCMCKTGYLEMQGKCMTPTPNPNPPKVPSCNVATYWDDQQLRCLPCTSGCLSCITCYECTSCQPGFYLDFASSLCIQICGDGQRYTLACDDGNNNNGDGCSSDCKVEVGSNCVGGSPNSKDICTKTLPQALVFSSTGQSHLYGKVVLNVRVNYLPLALIQSASDCSKKCSSVLSVQIVSGDKSTTGIKASYIATTSFSFSVEIDFQRQPIGLFTVEIGINPNLVQKYFSGTDVSQKLRVDVNPAFLAVQTYKDPSSGSGPDVLV